MKRHSVHRTRPQGVLIVGLLAIHPFLVPAGANADAGERIVFSATLTNGQPADIYAINTDGTGEVNLTADFTQSAYDPRLSPDGSWIAFNSTGSGNESWVMRADGSARTKLPLAAQTYGPSVKGWLDNDTILYVDGPRAGVNSIRKVRVDGTGDTLVIGGTVFSNPSLDWPAYSPLSGKLAFNAQVGSWSPTCDIYLSDADGSSPQRFFEDAPDTTNDGGPVWSRDGQTVYWNRSVSQGVSPWGTVVKKALNSTNSLNTYDAVVVANDGSYPILRAVSPDDSTLLLTTSSGQLQKLSLSTSNRATIFTAYSIGNAEWGKGMVVPLLAEDFSNGLSNWMTWGSPRPVVAASVAGKTSVFDNNGDPNYDSGAYSKGLVGSSGGFLLESDELLQMSNPAGCWLALNLGLTKTPNPSNPDSGNTQDNGDGIRISFWFDGDACWASPPELHRHAWAAAHLYAEDGTYVDSDWSGFNADAFTNAWQHLRILVLPDRTAKFYIGTNLLWTAPKKLHPSVLAGQNIVLSGRSSGSAGKAYHDNVRFTAIANDFYEDFDNGLADWTSFGQPRPVIVGSFQGRTNVFDNMGDPNYNSGSQTKRMVAAPGGFVLQWDNYLQVFNTAGCWVHGWVGLTKNPNPVNGDNGGVDEGQGIMFSIDYAGGACWATPAQYLYHAYLNCLVYAEDGTYDHSTDYSLNGDAYINAWQTMTIQVTPDRFAHFYMGTNLVWSSTKRLHPSIMEGQTLASSGRSSGSAGKVYVDQIRFSEMPSITAQPVTQSVGPGGEVTFSVGAGGAQPLTYQWYLNGVPIAGATNASLTINKVGCEKVGTYSVTVGNWAGTITSQSAILSLLGLQMCATLDLCGPVSTPYLIEFKTSLNTNWTTLTNITLPASPFTFIDLGSRGQPQRFYRATPLP